MGKVTGFIRSAAYCFLLVLLSLPLQAKESDFPVADSLRPAIRFWVKVYTEVDTSNGYLHDAENLGVIYTVVPREQSGVDKRRNTIIADLKVLASGKRSGLSDSQRQLLALWGEDVSNARLARAAENVRFQLGQSDRFLAGLKRSGAYRRHIEAVIEAKGMPIELAVLPHVESSFHPGAYSSVAATGMWQFMRETAQRFMQVDQIVDQRLDPYDATYAAMDLLEYNHNALGTWPLALTAYNHGTGGMARAVRETGTTDMGKIIANYKGPRFGFASRNFYPQFLAVLEVERRIDEFFGEVEYDRAPEFLQMELDAFVDARVLAQSLGVPLADLQRDNPALQPAVWSGTKRIPRGFKIKINRLSFGGGDLLAALNAMPRGERFGEQIPDLTYTVRSGDSLSVIANRYDTTVSQLVAMNQLRDRHRLRVGQVLLLPQDPPALAGGGTLVASTGGGSAAPARVAPPEPQSLPEDGKYIVKRGDTLASISRRYQVPESTLLSLNRLSNRNLIFPGQTLTLQGSVEAEAVLARAAQAQVAPATAVAAELQEVVDDIGENLASAAAEEAGPQLAQLSPDSGSAALEVDTAIAVVEKQEQLLADLASDPADYGVAPDGTVEVQVGESLGHFADWLGLRSVDLRNLNKLGRNEAVISGTRLKLDFAKVDVRSFENARRQYHRDLQSQYFDNWRIRGTEKYSIRNRDLLVNLVRQRSIPLWLFRQYNPDVDTGRLKIGQELVFPVVERVDI